MTANWRHNGVFADHSCVGDSEPPGGGEDVRVLNYSCVPVAGLCDETDPEYKRRFDADKEYIRELIDRIYEMSLCGVKLCNRCTEKMQGE